MSWDAFVKNKSEVPEALRVLVVKFNGLGNKVENLRCDNAGEHQTELRELCDKFGINIEYTAPNTPQQNGVVERKFETDRTRGYAMMRAAKLSESAQKKLWAEAFNTATKVGNIMYGLKEEKCPYEKFHGKEPKLNPKHLIEFGRIGYVTDRDKMKAKKRPKSKKMIMVGYADNHSPDTYRMFDPSTNRIKSTRDVRWADWNRNKPEENLDLFDKDKVEEDSPDENEEEAELKLDDDDEDPDEFPTLDESELGRNEAGEGAEEIVSEEDGHPIKEEEDEVSDNKSVQTQKRANTKLPMEVRKLHTEYNPTIAPKSRELRNLGSTLNPKTFYVEEVYNTSLVSDPGEPKSYKQAMNGPEKEKWKESIKQEFDNFLSRNAWKKVSRHEVVNQKKRKLITTKFVFKKKVEQDKSIRYKTRCVTRGFMQIPGVDYTESFAPVATDTSIRAVIGIYLYYSTLKPEK
jgi:hypothetical protein